MCKTTFPCITFDVGRLGLRVGTATYKPTAGRDKQGDQAFLPPSRIPSRLPSGAWATFVIETGVSESLNRLRTDARRWFINLQGEVRIVVLISIKPTKITFESGN